MLEEEKRVPVVRRYVIYDALSAWNSHLIKVWWLSPCWLHTRGIPRLSLESNRLEWALSAERQSLNKHHDVPAGPPATRSHHKVRRCSWASMHWKQHSTTQPWWTFSPRLWSIPGQSSCSRSCKCYQCRCNAAGCHRITTSKRSIPRRRRSKSHRSRIIR